jgi:predicted dehydrogenase
MVTICTINALHFEILAAAVPTVVTFSATKQFEACLARYHSTGIYGIGWDEYIRIDGTKGRLEIYYPGGTGPWTIPVRVRLHRESARTWEEPQFEPVNVFQLEVEAFARCCSKGLSAEPSIREAAQVDFWIDACYESARDRQTISFPTDLQ